MSFTQSTFAPVGPQSSDAPAVYSYSTSDTLATVKGAGYFVDKENQLEEGDIVFTQSSDGFTIMEVSAIQRPIYPTRPQLHSRPVRALLIGSGHISLVISG
jgi:hypothetical protein